jgi:hypothetical protein
MLFVNVTSNRFVSSILCRVKLPLMLSDARCIFMIVRTEVVRAGKYVQENINITFLVGGPGRV